MPTGPFRRLNLDLIFPPFRMACFELIARCEKEGASYEAIFGHRSFEEQGRMYRAWQDGKGGRAAPPGLSGHQYAICEDFARDKDPAKPGLQADWTDPAYEPLGRHATAMGLHWGVSYSDRLHIGWPGYVRADELRPLQTIYLEHLRTGPAGALAAVHRHLEAEMLTTRWRAANPRLSAELQALGFLDAPRSTA